MDQVVLSERRELPFDAVVALYEANNWSSANARTTLRGAARLSHADFSMGGRKARRAWQCNIRWFGLSMYEAGKGEEREAFDFSQTALVYQSRYVAGSRERWSQS